MARITIEDCLEHVPNRFALVLLAAERTKQIIHGSTPLVHDHRENKEIVTALREIASERVHYYEREVHEFDPAAEAEIRRAAQIRPFPEGQTPSPAATAIVDDSDYEDDLEDADLDEEFAEETDLDKLFSKLDSGDDDSDDDDDDEDDDVEESDDTDDDLGDIDDIDDVPDADADDDLGDIDDLGDDEDFEEEEEEEEEEA